MGLPLAALGSKVPMEEEVMGWRTGLCGSVAVEVGVAVETQTGPERPGEAGDREESSTGITRLLGFLEDVIVTGILL